MNGNPHALQSVYQVRGEIVRRESTPQKSGEGDSHLDSRQKFCRHPGKLLQSTRTLICLRQLLKLCVVDRDHRDLRAGKHRI